MHGNKNRIRIRWKHVPDLRNSDTAKNVLKPIPEKTGQSTLDLNTRIDVEGLQDFKYYRYSDTCYLCILICMVI